jgi:hypothetical protein
VQLYASTNNGEDVRMKRLGENKKKGKLYILIIRFGALQNGN